MISCRPVTGRNRLSRPSPRKMWPVSAYLSRAPPKPGRSCPRNFAGWAPRSMKSPYTTPGLSRMAPPDLVDDLENGRVDMVTFTSSSTVKHFHADAAGRSTDPTDEQGAYGQHRPHYHRNRRGPWGLRCMLPPMNSPLRDFARPFKPYLPIPTLTSTPGVPPGNGSERADPSCQGPRGRPSAPMASGCYRCIREKR